ncbi:MAG: PAS domain S-box protein [Verrucomicrobia bacterium]|nr:PAS domain S-box protein [Verrucomicrobiota bacterium]MBU4496963.1 PAS domain S-box protein [Verrucomicrobiota bacterium]
MMAKTDNKSWLQAIFTQSPDGIVVQTLDGTILAANDMFIKMFSAKKEQVVGKNIQDLIPADQRNRWQHDINKLIHAEWTLAEGISLQSNGRRMPIQINLVAQVDYDGQQAIILHLRDIAVFYSVEQALVASEGQWERSFDAITDSMCLLDRSGRILRANQAMTQRFQSVNSSLVGQNYLDIFGCIHRPGTPAACDLVNDAPCTIDDISFPNIEGWFCISTFPLKDSQTALTGAILIIKDITEAYKMRDALKKSESGLRQAAKMEAVGRLAGGIAHDFNNILTSILGFSSLILRTLTKDDPTRTDIEEIVHAAERATALTRQLLDFSHERALETKAVQLNTVIKNIETFLRRTIGEDIKLALQLSEGLWNVQADESRLEQILVNLSINSRDVMPKGGQLIIETSNQILDRSFCSIHPKITPGHYVLLDVSDTGHGMPPEVLDHIFEPFFTTKEKGKGTGLGLTTIYSIVRQFGGCISCYSEVDKGTTFKIYLPRCRDAQEPTPDITPETSLAHGHETVLVVDDEPNIVAMIGQLLKGLGYHVLMANSSTEALKISEQYSQPISLVLTDVIMPDMRGTDLVHSLTQKRPEIRFIFMSGYANGIALQTTGINTNEIFLQKPFSLETLSLSVRKMLDQPPRPADAEQPPGS